MTLLIIGLVLFFLPHVFATFRPARAAVIERVGENGYKGLFSIFALVGLGVIVWGKATAPFIHVYPPVVIGYKLIAPLMVVSFILMAGANMKTNIKRVTRHPMLWGVTLWALAHLLVNGDLASMLIFLTFLAYSLYDMVVANMRGVTKATEAVAIKYDIILVAAGTISAVVFAFAHRWLIGVPAIVG